MDTETKKLLKTNIRTNRQNRALWKMYEILAEQLNESGNDMRRTLRHDIDIPWSKDTVHDYLWIPIQKAQLQKKSTTELTTKEIDKVFETLNRHLADRFGLHVPFPSIEALIERPEL